MTRVCGSVVYGIVDLGAQARLESHGRCHGSWESHPGSQVGGSLFEAANYAANKYVVLSGWRICGGKTGDAHVHFRAGVHHLDLRRSLAPEIV